VYFIYSILTGFAALVSLPYWIIKGLRQGKYLRNLRERLGFAYPELANRASNANRAVWMHAVSVGEVLSGIALAQRLKDAYPAQPLVISTTTMTGYALARQRLEFADAIIYFPLDWAFCVRRAFRAVRPAVVIILETELWPNFLHHARRANVPVILAGGRISDRSYARYQKFLKLFGFYLRPLLRDVLSVPAAFLMQSETDARRIQALGAPANRVRVNGNLKYDSPLPAATALSEWLGEEVRRKQRRPVIVAGSVVATEEPLALIAFGVLQGEFPRALLVLAPRKPERFEPAAQFIEESRRKYVRRSRLAISGGAAAPAANGASQRSGIPDEATVVLLDSIGELASLYALADGVFVGGSLVPSGGHNILEPGSFGKVPVFGESMENFAEAARQFLQAGAAVQVSSPEDAGVAWIAQLRAPETTREKGIAAQRLVEESRGATERTLQEIASVMNGSARG
jgi:3-deoxy-D-manno-octulosonic-acid transferase